MDFNIVGGNLVGLTTSQSHQESGSQGIRDLYTSNKDPPGFFVEPPRSFLGNTTHWSGSDDYDICTEGLDVYRLLDLDGNNYQARKDHLEDDYRKALEDARHEKVKIPKVTVGELTPCEYCMRDINEAYLNGEFLPKQSDTSVSGFDVTA